MYWWQYYQLSVHRWQYYQLSVHSCYHRMSVAIWCGSRMTQGRDRHTRRMRPMRLCTGCGCLKTYVSQRICAPMSMPRLMTMQQVWDWRRLPSHETCIAMLGMILYHPLLAKVLFLFFIFFDCFCRCAVSFIFGHMARKRYIRVCTWRDRHKCELTSCISSARFRSILLGGFPADCNTVVQPSNRMLGYNQILGYNQNSAIEHILTSQQTTCPMPVRPARARQWHRCTRYRWHRTGTTAARRLHGAVGGAFISAWMWRRNVQRMCLARMCELSCFFRDSGKDCICSQWQKDFAESSLSTERNSIPKYTLCKVRHPNNSDIVPQGRLQSA